MSKSFSASDDNVKHWVMPEVRGDIVGLKDQALRPQTVEDIETLQKQAYEEGKQQGIEDGKKAGMAEMQARAQQLVGIMHILEKPLQQLDKDVEKQLLELTLCLTQMLLKKECATDARHIQGVIHEALDFLPIHSLHIQIRLNPADIALLSDAGIDIEAQDWNCIEDPSVSQGGCLIESDQSHIDASVESRVQQLVDQLFEQHAVTGDDDAN
ncbi:MAG: FliH/SctL family protein [Gammaproteobacteria bacterium]|nr:FliH/SctL family protein [Gammaproteobacteria bacterium]